MKLDTSLLLHPQIEHSKKLLNSLFTNGYALDASGVGQGKSFCAAWVAKYYNAPIVVICKRIGVTTWERVLAQFNLKAHVIIGYEKLCRGNTPYYKYNKKEYNKDSDWWESCGIKVKFPKNSLVIVDESHKCRGAKSLNGEMLRALVNSKYAILQLSASVATVVTEMRSTGYALRLHSGKNYPLFAKDHGAKYDDFGTLVTDSKSEESKQGMVKLHDLLYNHRKCASRMNREDFGTIFPDNHVIAESFDLGNNTNRLAAVYDQMHRELNNLDKRAGNYSSHHFAVMMEARRKSELLKVPAMIEWAEDLVSQGIAPVLFFNFADSLDAVFERLNRNTRLKDKLLRIVGGQPINSRNIAIDEFQANIRKAALINMRAGSDTISLHDLHGDAPRESCINPGWSAIDILQALGRICRANGKTKCVQKFMFAAGIEEKQRERIHFRLGNLSQLNDGDLSLLQEIPLY